MKTSKRLTQIKIDFEYPWSIRTMIMDMVKKSFEEAEKQFFRSIIEESANGNR